jgi:hypothetical protein
MNGGGVFTMVMWGIVAPIVLTFVLVGDPLGLPLAALALPFMFPWLTARFACVPLGAPRAAYLFGRLAEVFFGRDRVGGARLAAAWAALRRPRTASLVWVERRLAADERPIGGASVAAAGFLAAAAGDDAGARLLLASIAHLDAGDVPRTARALAAEWLSAEAAERGDWAAVRAPLAHTRLTRFLATVACRFLGEPIADGALRRAWLLEMGRREF